MGLYRSRDAGGRWEKTTEGLNLRWLADYEIDPRDSRIVYLGACEDPGRGPEEAGLYKTLDGGRSWERLARKGWGHFGATLSPQNSDWVYMTLVYNGDKVPGLWFSRDAGRNWEAFEDYPFCSAQRVCFDPEDKAVIYVTSYGGGVWRGPAEP